ncbi:MAG: DUF1059 domain-containing protein [Chloroflexi bacterium]|nr:DUF1059 domain-containing protein [Chloroflexota bacterium]
MAEVKCPECGGTISSSTEQDLVNKFRQHAKEHHGMEVSEEQVKHMMQKQNK